jgi:hypothetical protein
VKTSHIASPRGSPPNLEDPVDGAMLSHLIAWTIGAHATLGGVLVVGAFVAMGRSAYRQD